MLPNPLHPAVVHFPIVLSILLPIFALGAVWAIRRGAVAWKAWAIPFAMAAVLTLSVWVAIRTGEAQEDRVEPVVGEQVLHEHEEAAERFLVFSGVLLLVAAAGLVGGTTGKAARGVATVGSFVLLGAGALTGKSGGEMVYEHGAASAYSKDAGAQAMNDAAPARGDDD